MKPILLLLPLVLLFTACTPKPVITPEPKEFEIPDEYIRNMRHPTCDKHPYIYGFDERGSWRSDGCSREYINKEEIPYQDQMKMQKRKYGN